MREYGADSRGHPVAVVQSLSHQVGRKSRRLFVPTKVIVDTFPVSLLELAALRRFLVRALDLFAILHLLADMLALDLLATSVQSAGYIGTVFSTAQGPALGGYGGTATTTCFSTNRWYGSQRGV